MNQQDRRLAIVRSIMWSLIVLIGMCSGFFFALSMVGAIDWLSPNAALFTVLGTLVLTATMFSLMLGGGMTKAEREAHQQQGKS